MGTDPRTVEGYCPYWGVLPLFLENIEKLCFGLVWGITWLCKDYFGEIHLRRNGHGIKAWNGVLPL